jgi:hypothetical protein
MKTLYLAAYASASVCLVLGALRSSKLNNISAALQAAVLSITATNGASSLPTSIQFSKKHERIQIRHAKDGELGFWTNNDEIGFSNGAVTALYPLK